MGYWESIGRFHQWANREGTLTPEATHAIQSIREFYTRLIGPEAAPPPPVHRCLSQASTVQSRRIALLGFELGLAERLIRDENRLRRLTDPRQWASAMAEVEVAAAIVASGGQVVFVPETAAKSPDLEVLMNGNRWVIEVTSLREANERERASAVHDLIFRRCAHRLWWGGEVERPPSHKEFLKFEEALLEAADIALKTGAHQRIELGDWLRMDIACPGHEPYPPGLGHFEMREPDNLSLDRHLARKIHAKRDQAASLGLPAVVVAVDEAGRWGRMGEWRGTALPETLAALARAPEIQGAILATCPYSGPWSEPPGIDVEGPKKTYNGRPLKVVMGAIGSISGPTSNSLALDSTADAIANLESRRPIAGGR